MLVYRITTMRIDIHFLHGYKIRIIGLNDLSYSLKGGFHTLINIKGHDPDRVLSLSRKRNAGQHNSY